MTKITQKLSHIEFGVPKAQELSVDDKVQKSGDAYQAADGDSFKSLIDGNPKAIASGVIAEMYEAASNTPQEQADYYEKMQDFMGNFIVGDNAASWKAPEDSVGDVPYVPDLHEDILSVDPDSVMTMEPVVARYAALEIVLKEMIDAVTSAMHPSMMSQMSASEFRSLEAYKRKIEETLGECRLQRDRAERYLEKQKENEEAGIW
ncbi:MAG: hypothetical protein WC683_14025 [bacterium]